MTRREALYAALLAILMLSAGLTWRFGWYGLVGPSTAVLAGLLFVTIREDDSDG